MTENKTLLNVYEVNKICDCGGVMVNCNLASLTYPSKYKYVCYECGKEEYLDCEYPMIKYERCE